MASGPLAFFGFDAAEPALVRQGIEEGWLPTLAGLKEAGRYAVLAPVPSGFHSTSWASTVTGTDVGDHRLLLDRTLEPGSYRIVDVQASAVRRPPFWRYLSDAGLRSTVSSIYSAPILPSFNGTQVQGWGSLDPYFAKFADTFFDPPEVEGLLRRAVGHRQALYRVSAPRSTFQYRRYRDRLLRSIDEQTRGLAALIDGTDWDFFFGSFSEPHQAGHLLWHLGDPQHPAHDPSARADVRAALITIYRAVDAGLGHLIRLLPEECRVFVLTPHGMGPNQVQDPIEPLLELGGWLVRRSRVSKAGLRQRARQASWALGRRVVPVRSRLRVRIARSRMGRDDRAGKPLSDVDWSRTQAFALPADMTSHVRINLVGREPEGIVGRGDEYDRLCDDLSAALRGVTNADSGLPAVRDVIRGDELFGRVEGGLPDICVIWDDEHHVRRFHLERHGTTEAPRTDPRTGQHRHPGFILGAGPGIAPSAEEGLGTLLDVAPTALALLGVDRPPELRGRPIRAFGGS